MKKLLYILIATVLLFSSCEDHLDVNSDPNNPTEVTPDLLLPVAQTYTARYIQENRGASHLGNMMMYTWSESYGFSWYTDEFKYQVTTTFYDDLFDDAYILALKQYQDLVELGEGFEYYQGVGKIMQMYHFQLLVDFYGDIPYSEALGRGTLATPKYDDAATIYKDLVAQLDTAITYIKDAPEATAMLGVDDIMFGGDMTEWIKFANTVKMRILVRMSDVDAGFAGAEIAKISSEGFITDDVLVNPGYIQEDGKQNPFWNGLGWDFGGNVTMNHNATCATDYILEYMTNTNDLRIDTMFAAGKNGHLGVPQGVSVGEEYGQDFVSLIGNGLLKGFDMGANIFSLAESELNQALAINSNLMQGDAKAKYESGVTASFEYLGLTAGQATGYLGQTGVVNVSFDDSDPLEAIITQKWLATTGITAEQSWFDYSRTGFPRNLPISKKASTSDRPVRLFYPSSEITNNSVNIPTQKDAFTAKIFWAN